jgi:hypothetical protein
MDSAVSLSKSSRREKHGNINMKDYIPQLLSTLSREGDQLNFSPFPKSLLLTSHIAYELLFYSRFLVVQLKTNSG